MSSTPNLGFLDHMQGIQEAALALELPELIAAVAISPQRLADEVGVAYGTVRNWCARGGHPGRRRLPPLARIAARQSEVASAVAWAIRLRWVFEHAGPKGKLHLAYLRTDRRKVRPPTYLWQAIQLLSPTQRQTAEALGVNPSTFRNWATGQSRPGQLVLPGLASAFDMYSVRLAKSAALLLSAA